MAAHVKPIPEGYHSVTPYLIVHDGPAALAWYAEALGAQELFRMEMPSGKIGHAELQVGTSRIMLADESPDSLAKSPRAYGGCPIGLLLYVEGVDAQMERAQALGAKVVRPVEDKFYGDRSGTLEDPFGYQWTLATHVEDVAPEEMQRRLQALQHS
jgi:PhnB protein